ncbi:MAG: hypothetical protein JO128_21865, partial [Alphaproteobacteria bacterium]|nr:hypothetical protein [Alphaproteobacteria bacterium]
MSACSQLPPDYDPITQVGNAKRAVLGWFGDEQPPPPDVEPPPAQGRPIPNLGTVPPPPLVTAGQREQRQKEVTALQADRAAAAKADETLRAQTGAQVPAKGESSPPAPRPLPPAPSAGTSSEPPNSTASAVPS